MDPDAGNCDAAFGALTFGCGTEPEAEYDAGFYTFDGAQAQACLAAFAAATDCSSATQLAISTACANLLGPNVPEGGTCINDANCIPPAPGVGPSQTFGCDTESGDNGTGCTWTCSYGHHLGEVCGSGANGSGCAEGSCVSVSFTDGGSNLLCVPAAAEGEPCGNINQGGNGNTCADPNDFCSNYTFTCTARSAAFGACDPGLCPGYQTCPCDTGTFCVADLADGGGSCLPVLDGGDCGFSACASLGGDSCPCSQLANSRCVEPTDGGDIGACQPYDGVGAACDPTFCPLGARCNCDPSLLCDPTGADGGNVCVSKHGVGGQCYPGQCFDPNDPSCRCDPSQALYCRSDQTCQLHVGDGGACDHSEIRQCDDGLACSNSLCIDANPTQLGEACAPNDGVWCQNGLTCSDFANGVCVQPGSLGDPCFVNGVQPCVSPLHCASGRRRPRGGCLRPRARRGRELHRRQPDLQWLALLRWVDLQRWRIRRAVRALRRPRRLVRPGREPDLRRGVV